MNTFMKNILFFSVLGLSAYLLIKLTDEDESNILMGGKGDDLSEDEVDQDELLKGIGVEMEHTTSKRIAKEIALDHLAEDPKYYTKLAKIHKENPRKIKKRK